MGGAEAIVCCPGEESISVISDMCSRVGLMRHKIDELRTRASLSLNLIATPIPAVSVEMVGLLPNCSE